MHCWFIYWKWVPLFQVRSLSLQFLWNSKHAVTRFYCLFHSSFVLMRSSLHIIDFKGKASCLLRDSEKTRVIHVCTNRVNYAKMGVTLTVHSKTALVSWDSRSSVWTKMLRSPRAQNSSTVTVLVHGCHGVLWLGGGQRDDILSCCLGMLLILSIVGLNEVLGTPPF